MLSFIPAPYRYYIEIFCLVVVCGVSYFYGWRGQHDALVAYRAEVVQEANDQAAASKAKDERNAEVAKGVKNDYETQLANNTALWNKRLLHAKRGSCGLPQAGNTASGVDATGSDPLSNPAKLILDCQATTVMLIGLQHWINETR